MSIKLNGEEVKNPVAVLLITILLIALAGAFYFAGAFIFVVFIGFLLALFALFFILVVASVPVHFILRACGRKGFFSRNGGSINWQFDETAFHR